MQVETVAQIIQLVIAPAVMISGCTMILNGILNRYNKISDRIRSLSRERAELLDIYDVPEQIFREAVYLIDRQLVLLTRRHLLIQKTSLTFYGAILLFLLSMLAISLAKIFKLGEFSGIALLLFLLGNGNLLVGVILASWEVYISHQAIHSEVQWIMTLSRPALHAANNIVKKYSP
jgi:hypothetical protein